MTRAWCRSPAGTRSMALLRSSRSRCKYCSSAPPNSRHLWTRGPTMAHWTQTCPAPCRLRRRTPAPEAKHQPTPSWLLDPMRPKTCRHHRPTRSRAPLIWGYKLRWAEWAAAEADSMAARAERLAKMAVVWNTCSGPMPGREWGWPRPPRVPNGRMPARATQRLKTPKSRQID